MSLDPGTDSYTDLSTLTGILSDLGHTSYLDSTPTLDQEAHARQATLYLDLGWQWVGVPAVAGQALAWPRRGAVDQDGLAIPSDHVPDAIITSQALLMAACAAGPLDGGSGGSDREILAEHADDAGVQYAPGSADRRFPMVSRLVAHLCTSHLMGGFRQVACARG